MKMRFGKTVTISQASKVWLDMIKENSNYKPKKEEETINLINAAQDAKSN